MARHSVLQTFYSSDAWRSLRLTIIAERGPRCQECGQLVSNTRLLTAHHEIELTPDNVDDAMIALNPALIKIICHSCHNRIHGRFIANKQRRVYLIYGPPLAGKKTFVADQMMRGDLVVDMDRLFEAVSGQSMYDKPDNLIRNVLGIHDLLLDNVKTRAGKWGTAWVIGGYPERFKRERTADTIGAEMVFMDAPKEVCLSRLSLDNERQEKEWAGYIEKWFEKYS